MPQEPMPQKAVQEDDGKASRITVRLAGDLETGRADGVGHYTRSMAGRPNIPYGRTNSTAMSTR
jgi:hypothetical protein